MIQLRVYTAADAAKQTGLPRELVVAIAFERGIGRLFGHLVLFSVDDMHAITAAAAEKEDSHD